MHALNALSHTLVSKKNDLLHVCKHATLSFILEKVAIVNLETSTPQESTTSLSVHGVDLYEYDINTLDEKVMMNDNIVKVLLG